MNEGSPTVSVQEDPPSTSPAANGATAAASPVDVDEDATNPGLDLVGIVSFSEVPPPEQQDDDDPPCWPLQVLDRLFKLVFFYPIMIFFTMTSLILVVTFCVLPSLVVTSIGLCFYYCMSEDPIPLSIMLRYMFDPDRNNSNINIIPPNNNGPLTPEQMQEKRPIVQAKLIVRRLVGIVNTNDNDKNVESGGLLLQVVTERGKRLQFSAPLSIEECGPQEHETDKDGSSQVQGDSPPPNRGQEGGGSPRIPHYMRHMPGDGIMENQPQRGDDNDENDLVVVVEMGPISTSNNSLEDGDVEDPRGSSDHDEESTRSAKQDTGETDSLPLVETTLDACPTMMDETKEINDVETGENIMEESKQEDEEIAVHASISSPPSSGDYFGLDDHNDHARDRGTTCDICLLDYEVGDLVAWSPNASCSHTYHMDCILDWLVRKPSCPNCRVNYLKGAS